VADKLPLELTPRDLGPCLSYALAESLDVLIRRVWLAAPRLITRPISFDAGYSPAAIGFCLENLILASGKPMAVPAGSASEFEWRVIQRRAGGRAGGRAASGHQRPPGGSGLGPHPLPTRHSLLLPHPLQVRAGAVPRIPPPWTARLLAAAAAAAAAAGAAAPPAARAMAREGPRARPPQVGRLTSPPPPPHASPCHSLPQGGRLTCSPLPPAAVRPRSPALRPPNDGRSMPRGCHAP
jgi:hypothetical protein